VAGAVGSVHWGLLPVVRCPWRRASRDAVPQGLCISYPLQLEARPEADFPLQRKAVAVTGLEARHLEVAVGQARDVFEPRAQKRQAPRRADVKVGIEGPLVVPSEFMDLGFANALTASSGANATSSRVVFTMPR